MTKRAKKAIRAWMFIYAGLTAVFVSAAQSHDLPKQRAAALSPVSVGADAPAIRVDALVRRADI